MCVYGITLYTTKLCRYICVYIYVLGIIGTSHPTRYFVLWDDNKMATQQLYQFSYCMCFLFGR